MPDFLQRDQAPLRGDQWTALDQAVVQTARAILVGRRFITLVGPFGPGVEALPSDSLAGTTAGQIDLLGNAEGEAVGIEQRRYLPLPLIYKDFWVHWRDLEASRQIGQQEDAPGGEIQIVQIEIVLIVGREVVGQREGAAGGTPSLTTLSPNSSVPLNVPVLLMTSCCRSMIDWISCSGRGGQPGMYRSTGMKRSIPWTQA